MGYDKEGNDSMRWLLSISTFCKWTRKIWYGYEYYYRFKKA